jgi:hypothetical protein
VALWIAAGANPKQIATWAGHTSVSVVLDRYGHLFEGHEAAMLDRLDASVAWPLVSSDADVSAGFPRGFHGTRTDATDLADDATIAATQSVGAEGLEPPTSAL